MTKNIVVVGSINLDLVASVTRMPEEGETVAGSNFATYSGGKGANQAVGVGRLGGRVSMVGCVGGDLFAERLRGDIASAGVDIQFVHRVQAPSGSAIILVTPLGGNSIVVVPGANHGLSPELVESHRELLRDAGMILAQLEIPLATVAALARMSGEMHVPLMLDPAPVCALPPEILKHVTWLTPNESETRRILEALGYTFASTDEASLEAAAQRLLETGVRNVALKLGSRGVYLAGLDVESIYIPTFHVQAVDTTAAGDAFNAGFAFALVEGSSPLEAARFACAVAAVSVTRAGAQSSMPDLVDVQALLGASVKDVGAASDSNGSAPEP